MLASPGRIAGPDPGANFSATKKTASRRFFCIRVLRYLSNGECFDSLVQAALVTCSFVLGHNAFVDHTVDHRHSLFIGGRCCVLVAGITCLNNVLDLGAHKRTHAHVVLAGLFRLAGALSC